MWNVIIAKLNLSLDDVTWNAGATKHSAVYDIECILESGSVCNFTCSQKFMGSIQKKEEENERKWGKC